MNKIVLVTGATGGIGSAIVKEVIKNGMKVVIAGRNESKLNALIKMVGKENVKYDKVFDITDEAELKKFVNEIKDKGIQIDILINNAGNAFGLEKFHEAKLSDLKQMLDLNVKSLMLLSYYLLDDMVTRNSGMVINIGSTAGQFAYGKGNVYCASKAAVKTLSDGMRIDLMETNVKVTTIMPGLVETDFSLVRFENNKNRADEVYAGIDALQAGDIANAVMFVIMQPERCQISEISLLANQQGNGFTTHKK